MNNTLTDQFNTALSQYQATYTKYVNSLNNIKSKNNLMTLKNYALFGGTILSKNKLTNINDCKKNCLSNKSCNGLNFYTTNNVCSLIKNPQSIVPSKNTTTIANPVLYYSYQLQELNKKLININKQLINSVNLQENSDKIKKQRIIMKNNYDILNKERAKIKQMINEYDSINSANENSSLTVNMYYYRYLILILIVGLLIFMLINFSSSGQRGGGNNFIKDSFYLFIVILLCLGIS